MYRNKEALIYARKEAGLTQRELAEKAGLSVFTIMQLEQNLRKGANETWEKLEAVFEGEGGDRP